VTNPAGRGDLHCSGAPLSCAPSSQQPPRPAPLATSQLAPLADIASVLDDVATLTKVATKKTAGVLGDDLALNAEQVSGVRAERELPVVWAVAKGSLVNKAILVPAALAISAFIPRAVVPLLVVGGLFLCYEGFEKLAHKLLRRGDDRAAREAELGRARADPAIDPVALERDRIKGAIRTDFILSAEIIVITLGTVAAAPLGTRVTILAGIALLMTVGVYGLVAGIVKLDDGGLALSRAAGDGGWAQFKRAFGRAILRAAPWLMKGLSVAGTLAMFLVGGGILTHGIGPLHHLVEQWLGGAGAVLAALAPLLIELFAGVIAGALVLAVVTLFKNLRGASAAG
jgi:predicted DNA repair protein MutK